MFNDYYNLKEQPFGVTPNPRYLYLTPTHREAMASILYGVMENRGFSALIAPPGMGKTTLLFDLLQRCGQSMRTVFLFQFQPSPEGLLRNLLAELGIPDEGESFVGMQEKLNQAILQEAKQGKRIVVVVDEAQNFCEPVLEVLRMLSNFETAQEKLIHIILSGQPQLADMLFSPTIEQLRQRISIMAMLRPLNAQEIQDYIEHRLRVAGRKSTRPLFTQAACDLIAEYSAGIPRNINNYCFNALSLGYALKQTPIGREIIEEVHRDLTLSEPAPTPAAPHKSVRMPSVLPGLAPLPEQAARPGGGLRSVAAVLAILAALCVAGVWANERLKPAPPIRVAVPAPPPPNAVAETTTPIPAEESQVNIEAEKVPTTEIKSAAANLQDAGTVARETKPTVAHVRLVKASQKETLYQLCARNLTGCNAGALQEIQRLNPWLHNQYQLQAGQPVRIPVEEIPNKNRRSLHSKTHSGDKR